MSRQAPPSWGPRGGASQGGYQQQQQTAWKNAQQQQAIPQAVAAVPQYQPEDLEVDQLTGLPMRVATYLSNLYQAMLDNDVVSVRYLYYKGWKEISRSYYAQSEWPSAEVIAPLCDENEVFILCYRELCNRHVYMNTKPTIQQRFASWENYRALFDMFLDGATTSRLILPLEWLNDMIDEFLYQWQDYASFRHHKRDQAELELLRENPHVWKVQTVLGYLTSFVERSQISRESSSAQGGASAPQQYTILKALGAFSLVGLCRAQVLLADYRYALRVLDAIDIDDQRAIFTQIYTRVLVSPKTNKENSTSYAEENIINKHDKTLALAGLCHVLAPGMRIDDQIRRQITDKFENLVNVLNQKTVTDETFAVLEEKFIFACPKFVNPATPAALLPKVEGQTVAPKAETGDPRREFVRIQLKWFLEDARQQLSLPTIRPLLKMYKSIPVDKLSRFCQIDAEQFRLNLIFVKARSSQIVRGVSDGSAPIDGTRMTVSDVQFYVVGDKSPANDMVHIVSEAPTTSRHYNSSRMFITNSLKYLNTIAEVSREAEPVPEEVYDEPVDDDM